MNEIFSASIKEKYVAEADYSLAGNMSIPSHEDVENESLNTLLEFEQGMQPLPSITAEQR